MKLDVLVPTMHNISINEDFFKSRNINTGCVVVSQNDEKEGKDSLKNNTIIYSKTRGVSKSRNMAIDNSQADICLFCDDDIILNHDYEKIILDAYDKFKDADAITFLITMGGKLSDRIKAKKPIKHNKFSILRVGTNEITFKREVFKDKNIRFNEKFGPGSGCFEGSEETLLLTEMYKKGLKIYHVPLVISNHITENASNAFWDEKLIYTKAAFFRAYDKHLCLAYMLLLYFLKRKIIDKKISLKKYINICFQGIKKYDSLSSF